MVSGHDDTTTHTPSKRGRIVLCSVLIAILAVMWVNAFLLAPGTIDPLASVPPNREVEWTTVMDWQSTAIALFQDYWWFVAAVFTFLGVYACTGKMERLCSPLSIAAIIPLVLVVSLLISLAVLPHWVRQEYGDPTYQRIYGSLD